MIPLIFFCEMSVAEKSERADILNKKVISKKMLNNESTDKAMIELRKLPDDLVTQLEKECAPDTKELDKKYAEDFIQKLGEEALKIVHIKDIEPPEVQRGFELLLKSRFGLTSIAGFAIGPSFKELSKEEKEKVAKGCLLKDLYNQFLSKFANYKASTFTITRSKKKSYRHIEVESKLETNQEIKVIVWSVYLSKGTVKVYDVLLDGVSASNILKSVYADRMKKSKNFWKN